MKNKKNYFTLQQSTPSPLEGEGAAVNERSASFTDAGVGLKPRKAAFTLAEVLIVIGVIGVVAAITIPTLIPLIKDKVDTNRKEVIEDRLIQGMNQLNTLDDGFNASQYENTEGFVKALSKHYKMSQICGANDLRSCFPYTSLTYNKSDNTEATKNWADLKTPEDFGLKSDEYYAPAGFISAQGTPFVMLLKKDCIMDTGTGMRTIPTTCVAYMYDKNGSNIPNKFDSDLVHSEDIVIGKLMPKAILGGVKIMTDAFLPTPITKAECEADKSKYGINACKYDDDYWGGAMKACKTQGLRLPNEEELANMANALYKGMSATIDDSYEGTYAGKDENGNYYKIGSNESIPKALSILGSPLYDFWSGSEDSSEGAHGRNFEATWSARFDYFRNDHYAKAVCVGD